MFTWMPRAQGDFLEETRFIAIHLPIYMKKFLGKTFALFFAWLMLASGTWAQEANEPTKLTLKIEATSSVNPDQSGRASPIKVRVYELKDSASFAEADYFGLDTADKTLLAADMLAKDEFILRPGESRTIERKSRVQTTAIGILAGYRDLANANWRVVYTFQEPEPSWFRMLLPSILLPYKKAVLNFQLMPQGITVTEE